MRILIIGGTGTVGQAGNPFPGEGIMGYRLLLKSFKIF